MTGGSTFGEQSFLVPPTTPADQRRASIVLVDGLLAAGADTQQIRDALEMIGTLPYEAVVWDRHGHRAGRNWRKGE